MDAPLIDAVKSGRITIVPAVALAWNQWTGRGHDIAGPIARARVEPAPREENGGQRKRKAG